MDGLWTRNNESDADVNAPALARVSVAAGLYLWLHSRVFGTENNIRVSVPFLAGVLGVDKGSIRRATKALEREGLIAHETTSGNGGGSVFHVLGLTNEGTSARLKEANSPCLKVPNLADLSGLNGQICHPTKITDTIRGVYNEQPHGIYDR